MQTDQEAPVVVIGGGPAGLTAAYELARRRIRTLVLEAEGRVGGLACTVENRGFRFDIGGHRFFSKLGIVRELWREILGPDLLTRPRLSRIYYRGRFYNYPFRPLNALRNLGPRASAAVLASYVWARLFPRRPEATFEDWVSNRFGRRLYRTFFKTYTEKVWGIPCDQIGAQWAKQRIKKLSLGSALANMLAPSRARNGNGPTSLIEEFEYPRLGPGMMWEAFRDRVEELGGEIRLDARVAAVRHDDRLVTAVETDGAAGRRLQHGTHFLSSMPLRDLIEALDPPAPAHVVGAAARLRYRDFLTVAVVVEERDVFEDNWIYIHDESVRVGRIQNFRNWSPDMVPNDTQTCLGLEYFCFEGDGLWTMSDAELVRLATDELAATGLVAPDKVAGGVVVRVPKAYPVYDRGYQNALAVVRRYLTGFPNLQVMGRNGMHKYNNQDHSMLTAILAVRNLLGERHDVWSVNSDEEYHEEIRRMSMYGDTPLREEVRALARSQPPVPERVL